MPSVAPVGVRRDVCDDMHGYACVGHRSAAGCGGTMPVFVTPGFRFGSALASAWYRAEPGRIFPDNGRREPSRHQGL